MVSQDDLMSFHFLSCYYSCLCNQIRISGRKGLPLSKWREDFGEVWFYGFELCFAKLSGIFWNLSPCCQSSDEDLLLLDAGVHVNLQEASLTQDAFTNRYTRLLSQSLGRL